MGTKYSRLEVSYSRIEKKTIKIKLKTNIRLKKKKTFTYISFNTTVNLHN